MRKPAAAVYSLAIHALAIAFLFLLTFQSAVVTSLKPPPTVTSLTAPITKFKNDAGGGGRALERATRGDPPPKPAHKLWTPPTLVIPDNPKLVIEQALDMPDIRVQPMTIGNPSSIFGGKSPGVGPSGRGIGDGLGEDGIGDGSKKGPRVGGPGGLQEPRQRLTRAPQLIHKEEPEYSEEARKVRFQGTVKLAIDVDTNGRAVNIRVTQSVGLGLDERAIAAVLRWRFRPALVGDKAVVAPATVEVGFHLL